MTSQPLDPEVRRAALERGVDGLLKNLPERKAPSSLEQRVLAELSRRARLPWWRRSCAEWPAAARGLLLGAGAAAAAIALLFMERASALTSTGVRQAAALALGRIDGHSQLSLLVTDLVDTLHALSSAVPPSWTTALLAASCFGFALLAAAGVAARRAFPSLRLTPRS